MQVLVTGATGFVGGYVTSTYPCVTLENGGVQIDLRNAAAVKEAVSRLRFSDVIHLAAQSFVPQSFAAPMETFNTNFYGTFNLLSALKETDFRGRFLYVGTADVYGRVREEDLPISESLLPHPRNPYAVSKLAAEALCYQWSQTERFEIIMARPFNHVGPGQSENFVVSSLAKQIAHRRCSGSPEPLLAGNIDVTRDFTDVRDVVRAYGQLLEKGVNGEVYNVCSGTEVPIRDIAESLQALAGINVGTMKDESLIRASEQRRSVGSNRKIHEATGWSPQIPLQQTLQEILDSWISQ